MSDRFYFSAPVAKADDVKAQIHADGYLLGHPDSQRDVMIQENELEKMIHTAPWTMPLTAEHGGPRIDAHLVEKYLADRRGPDGKLTKAARFVYQLTRDAFDKYARKYSDVSIEGTGRRRPAVWKDGTEVRELFDVTLTALALVPKGASVGSTYVAKGDPLAALVSMVATMKDEQHALVTASDGHRPRDVRKAVEAEHEARTALRIEELRKQHAVLTSRLERSWERGDVALERRCLRRLDDLECELEALGHDTRPTASSVFSGGSVFIDAGLDLIDDALGVQSPRNPRVKKAEEIDLSTDMVI